MAEQTLNECDVMLRQNDGWYYPSRYKIENNRILLKFLLDERTFLENRNQYLISVKKAAMAFSEIMENQEDEVSHVILFNYLALSFDASGCHAVSTTLSTVQSELIIPALI